MRRPLPYLFTDVHHARLRVGLHDMPAHAHANQSRLVQDALPSKQVALRLAVLQSDLLRKPAYRRAPGFETSQSQMEHHD